MKKILSLAISAFNMEAYLDRCLRSVTIENLDDKLEVIVVNDGSTDHTSDLAHSYEDRFPKIVKVIDKENNHYGSCINAALAVAQGKYFRPLDADDWVDPTSFLKLIEALETCDADLVVTEYSRVCKNDKLQQILPNSIKAGKVYEAQNFSFIDNKLEAFVSMHSMTYKLQLLRDIKLQLIPRIGYSDTLYNVMPIDHIDTIAFFPYDVYQYDVSRDGQTMQKGSLAKSMESFYYLSEYIGQYYLNNASHNNAIVRSNQRCFLRRVLYYFFMSALVFGKSTPETDEMLSKIWLVVEQDKELKAEVCAFRYKKIHFVKFWHVCGIRIFSFIPKSLL